jgi:S-adenosylmethionine:tRNA ribosyltransferase-isomerase
LTKDYLLIRNVTKFIKARIYLQKNKGKLYEFFFLKLIEENENTALTECLIKNVKKIKPTEILKAEIFENGILISLSAQIVERNNDTSIVKFEWNISKLGFQNILNIFGKAPLPPYIKREVNLDDEYRYQTVYAKENGSVAAPTAGLHITRDIEEKLKDNNINISEIILHVGLGTFRPIKNNNFREHEMHNEEFVINIETIKQLSKASKNKTIAVGTTTLRTLESLYIASHFLNKETIANKIQIEQWEYNKINSFMPTNEVWEKLIFLMNENKINTIYGNTSLMISPEYKCKTIDYLITNFHQPNSTLLLIISSIIGNEWKKIYKYAIDNNFRFLSYGDSCLFKNNKNQ